MSLKVTDLPKHLQDQIKDALRGESEPEAKPERRRKYKLSWRKFVLVFAIGLGAGIFLEGIPLLILVAVVVSALAYAVWRS